MTTNRQDELKALVLEVIQNETTVLKTVSFEDIDQTDDTYINMKIELKTVLE